MSMFYYGMALYSSKRRVRHRTKKKKCKSLVFWTARLGWFMTSRAQNSCHAGPARLAQTTNGQEDNNAKRRKSWQGAMASTLVGHSDISLIRSFCFTFQLSLFYLVLLCHTVTMALENANEQEKTVLAANDVNGTKLHANSDKDEDKTTTVSPQASYHSPPSKNHLSKNDKEGSAEYELFLLPESSPLLLPLPDGKKAKTDEPPSLDSMTLSELKQQCVMRGLKANGAKAALSERLQNPAVAAVSRHNDGFSPARVDRALQVAGYDSPENASLCAKLAIQKDIVLLRYGLDQVMATWECIQCQQAVHATLRQCLDQPDFGGDANEDGIRKVPCSATIVTLVSTSPTCATVVSK